MSLSADKVLDPAENIFERNSEGQIDQVCGKVSETSSEGVPLDHAESLSNGQVGSLSEEECKSVSEGESLDPADHQHVAVI